MPTERMKIVNTESISKFPRSETEIVGKALCACGLHSWTRANIFGKKYGEDGALVEFCSRPNCQVVRGVWKCKEGGKPKLYKNGKVVWTARFK